MSTAAKIPPHVLRMFALLSARWPNHPVSRETITVYAIGLADVPLKALEVAVVQWIRTGRFFPGVDELRDLANGPRAAHLSGEEAWAEVRKEIARVGWCGTPKFSSDAVRRTVDAVGGWQNLSTQTVEQVPANRAHFMRVFESFVRSEKREGEYEGARELVANLAGLLGGRPEQLYGKGFTDDAEEPPRRRDRNAEPLQVDDLDDPSARERRSGFEEVD